MELPVGAGIVRHRSMNYQPLYLDGTIETSNAILWMSYVEHTSGNYVRHSGNEGEKRLYLSGFFRISLPYLIDFFNKKKQDNIQRSDSSVWMVGCKPPMASMPWTTTLAISCTLFLTSCFFIYIKTLVNLRKSNHGYCDNCTTPARRELKASARKTYGDIRMESDTRDAIVRKLIDDKHIIKWSCDFEVGVCPSVLDHSFFFHS